MPETTARRTRSPGGYTLIELMATLVVLGIVITLAAPRMEGVISYFRRTSAVDRIATDLAYARIMAVREGRTASLRITGTTYTITVDTDAGGVLRTVKTVPLTADYTGVSVSSTQSRIAFDSRGMVRGGTGATIRVSHRGELDSLTVSPVGRVYR